MPKYPIPIDPMLNPHTAVVGEVHMYTNDVYIGIDPGKSGGVSVLTSDKKLRMFKMPVTEMDLLTLFRDLPEPLMGGIEYAAVEKVGGYTGEGQPGSAMFNFGFIVGAARTACLAAGISLEEVGPHTWQKALGIPSRKKTESKTQWKNRLKGHAQRLFPKEDIILQVADSVLIAEYCRRKRTGTL